MSVEMTSKCGFCSYREHCKSWLSDEEVAELIEAEIRYAKSRQAGSAAHRNLVNYLTGLEE